MKLLDRYILREMVTPFLIGQASIVLMLTGTVLYNNAEMFLIHQVPVADVARIVLYFIPFLIHMTMPVAMAVAASLAISRLTRDSEITVCRASGISLARIFLPIYLTGLCVSVFDFYFGEYVVPASMARFDAVRAEVPTHLRHLMPQPGQFLVATDQSNALYVTSMLPRHGYIELRGILIVSSPKHAYAMQTQPTVITAERGRYDSDGWTLYHASLLHFDMDSKNDQRILPKTMHMYIPVNPQAFQASFMMQMPMGTMANSSEMTFTQLGMDIKRNAEHGYRDPYTLLDYQFKLSVPFSCLVMALCCPPMAFRFARGGGFMGVLLSICLVFVYWNTLLLMRILGSPGAEGSAPLLPPLVAAWSQNVLYVLLGLIVLRRSE